MNRLLYGLTMRNRATVCMKKVTVLTNIIEKVAIWTNNKGQCYCMYDEG